MKKNLKFANHHLDFLEYRLKNPLFIAYAYNGGIGFTKRFLKGNKFIANKAYEPFMSMELMANDQSREYGKRVLTNYIIYRYLQKNQITLKQIIKDILSPQ